MRDRRQEVGLLAHEFHLAPYRAQNERGSRTRMQRKVAPRREHADAGPSLSLQMLEATWSNGDRVTGIIGQEFRPGGTPVASRAGIGELEKRAGPPGPNACAGKRAQRPFRGLAVGVQVLGGGADFLAEKRSGKDPPAEERDGERDDGQHADNQEAGTRPAPCTGERAASCWTEYYCPRCRHAPLKERLHRFHAVVLCQTLEPTVGRCSSRFTICWRSVGCVAMGFVQPGEAVAKSCFEQLVGRAGPGCAGRARWD